MPKPRKLRYLSAACVARAAFCWLLAVGVCAGEDFRVDSRVFQGRDEEPHATNMAIFRGGQIYDFSDQPAEITIFAPRFQRIILLDQTRKCKTELTAAEVERFCEALKTKGEKTTDAGLKFLLAPKFTMQTGATTGERIFQSEHITYQIQTFAPRSAAIAAEYREFCDLSAKLKALTQQGLPPFARLAVNEALAAENLVPSKVTLLIPSKSLIGGRNLHLRSEHEIQSRVTDSDQQKISIAEDALGTYQSVTLREYLTPAATTPR